MKHIDLIMQQFKTVLLATSMSFIFAACNGDGPDTVSTEKVAAAKAEDASQAIYSCPMHPEVTGKEGDACYKCGMKLVRKEAVAEGSAAYFMKFVSSPERIEPGKEVTLILTPKRKNAETEAVILETAHEKKIHLILVSDDLSWFEHLHPEYNADGSYAVKTKFPAAGNYKAFADYKPNGGSPMVDKLEIDVAGSAPAKKSFTTQKLSGHSGKYTVELFPEGGQLQTGADLHIRGVVKKNGIPIDARSLDNYLGAKGHFVLISVNEKEYLHVHPGVEEGKFDLHTTITKPGIYRGWLQINAEGMIHTMDFTWNVVQGNSTSGAKMHAGH